jgi:hypothetical protein
MEGPFDETEDEALDRILKEDEAQDLAEILFGSGDPAEIHEPDDDDFFYED